MNAIESQIDRHLSDVESAEAREEWVVDTVEQAFRQHGEKVLVALVGHVTDPSDAIENVRYCFARGDVWGAASELAHSTLCAAVFPLFEAMLDAASGHPEAGGAGVLSDDAVREYRYVVGAAQRQHEVERVSQRLSAVEDTCGTPLGPMVACQEPLLHTYGRDFTPHRTVVAGRVVTW